MCLFLLSLCFTPFFVSDVQRPYGDPAISLLAMGWLGVIGGHFSWFANPLYLIAVIYRNKNHQLAFFYTFLSLLFAMSFLLHKQILVDEGGGSQFITSYGYGYFLWLLSIVIMLFSQLSNLHTLSIRACKIVLISNVVYLATVIAMVVMFANHYYLSETSHHKLVTERNIFFKLNCPNAVERFYNKPREVNGIYFSDNNYRLNAIGYFNSGYISFYETNNDKSNGKPYIRFSKGSPNGQEVDHINSEYSVVYNNITSDLRKELGIHGANILVIDNSNNHVIASNTFYESHVLSSVNDFKCGKYHSFVGDALILGDKRKLLYNTKGYQ